MTTSSIIEGVDNDVLLAFLTLFLITVLTIIYYFNVSRNAATFSEGWGNLRTFFASQIARLRSSINPDNLGQSPSETTQNNAGTAQNNAANIRNSQSTQQHDNGQSVNDQNREQSEEVLRQTVGPRLEDRQTHEGCTTHGNINSNTTESQERGQEESDGRDSGDGIRQRTESSPSSTQSLNGSQPPSGSQVSVRVKHHEVERSFTVDPNITVIDLKRLSFPDELTQGRRVRFVYSGRLLNDDNASISFYGISNYSVIHAQISDVPQYSSASQHGEEVELDISRLFIPLLALILCGLWYGLISYRNLFNTTSTAILFVITAAYAFMVYVMFS